MKILLLNAGSSSLKAALMDTHSDSVLASGLADWAGKEADYRYTASDGKEHTSKVAWKDHGEAVRRFIHDLTEVHPAAVTEISEIAGVGHRVVHGGEFTAPVLIQSEVRSRITALADLAPLHNPPSLKTLAAAETMLPQVPQIAVFDTSFHSTLPRAAYTYPVPWHWTQEWGIRRFGFHGLSHAYCSRKASEMLARPIEDLRIVVCHLGHGCSAAAVQGGRSVDTTMGFTPLEGLMMGTRCGSIDPGVLLHVQHCHGLTAEQLDTALNRESGLLGLSGISGDMRQVLQAAREGQERAQLALDVYVHRVRQAIGALAASMGGVDCLVFTAGVGEHSAEIRRAVCNGIQFLGLELDAEANADCRPDAEISAEDSAGRILVIATREDLTMLGDVLKVLGQSEPKS